ADDDPRPRRDGAGAPDRRVLSGGALRAGGRDLRGADPEVVQRVTRGVATIIVAMLALATRGAAAAERVGVPPETPWTCPSAHPIKGYRSESGRLVYFVPANRFYDEASPDRCYESETDARSDGATPARDGRPAPARPHELA